MSIKSILLSGASLLVFFHSHPATAAADAASQTCLTAFFNEYSLVRSYTAQVQKKEYSGGALRTEHTLKVEHTKPVYVSITFLNKGNTGIKNNGMRVEYTGSESLNVALGESSGLGFLLNGPARLFIGSSMALTNPRVLEDEYFTINRVPLTYLAHILKVNFDSIRRSPFGGLSSRSGTCKISYTKHTDEVALRTMTNAYGPFQVEEEFGTLAFFVQEYNRDDFPTLYEFFASSRGKKVSIPRWFADFELDFDPVTHLPSRIAFLKESKIFAEYAYTFESIEK